MMLWRRLATFVSLLTLSTKRFLRARLDLRSVPVEKTQAACELGAHLVRVSLEAHGQ